MASYALFAAMPYANDDDCPSGSTTYRRHKRQRRTRQTILDGPFRPAWRAQPADSPKKSAPSKIAAAARAAAFGFLLNRNSCNLAMSAIASGSHFIAGKASPCPRQDPAAKPLRLHEIPLRQSTGIVAGVRRPPASRSKLSSRSRKSRIAAPMSACGGLRRSSLRAFSRSWVSESSLMLCVIIVLHLSIKVYRHWFAIRKS